MSLIMNLLAGAIAVALVSLMWHLLHSEANPLVAKQADRFIRQARSTPLQEGQTEEQVAVQLALADGREAAAAVVYARLYGVSIFDAQAAVERMI